MKLSLIIGSLVASAIGLSACTTLSRSGGSGYSEDDRASLVDPNEFYRERQSHNEQLAREELGWPTSRSLTDDERLQLEQRLKLRRLESKLEAQREKKQYFHYKSLMRSDAERIAFLSLPSVEVRERWANSRGLTAMVDAIPEVWNEVIEKNDLIVGMNQKAVAASWGDPDLVEVAGDPVYGNERWRYSRYVSGGEGYQKETRVVYFESGRVVGWESF